MAIFEFEDSLHNETETITLTKAQWQVIATMASLGKREFDPYFSELDNELVRSALSHLKKTLFPDYDGES